MYRLLMRFFHLYGKGFRSRFFWVCGLAIVAGIFETFGLLAIYPVLAHFAGTGNLCIKMNICA